MIAGIQGGGNVSGVFITIIWEQQLTMKIHGFMLSGLMTAAT